MTGREWWSPRVPEILPWHSHFHGQQGETNHVVGSWFIRPALLTDLTCHLKALSSQLQRRDKLLSPMPKAISALQNKITVPKTLSYHHKWPVSAAALQPQRICWGLGTTERRDLVMWMSTRRFWSLLKITSMWPDLLSLQLYTVTQLCLSHHAALLEFGV